MDVIICGEGKGRPGKGRTGEWHRQLNCSARCEWLGMQPLPRLHGPGCHAHIIVVIFHGHAWCAPHKRALHGVSDTAGPRHSGCELSEGSPCWSSNTSIGWCGVPPCRSTWCWLCCNKRRPRLACRAVVEERCQRKHHKLLSPTFTYGYVSRAVTEVPTEKELAGHWAGDDQVKRFAHPGSKSAPHALQRLIYV